MNIPESVNQIPNLTINVEDISSISDYQYKINFNLGSHEYTYYYFNIDEDDEERVSILSEQKNNGNERSVWAMNFNFKEGKVSYEMIDVKSRHLKIDIEGVIENGVYTSVEVMKTTKIGYLLDPNTGNYTWTDLISMVGKPSVGYKQYSFSKRDENFNIHFYNDCVGDCSLVVGDELSICDIRNLSSNLVSSRILNNYNRILGFRSSFINSLMK